MKSNKKLFIKRQIIFVNQFGELLFMQAPKFKRQKESFIIKKGS
jgi:hypothetical protein